MEKKLRWNYCLEHVFTLDRLPLQKFSILSPYTWSLLSILIPRGPPLANLRQRPLENPVYHRSSLSPRWPSYRTGYLTTKRVGEREISNTSLPNDLKKGRGTSCTFNVFTSQQILTCWVTLPFMSHSVKLLYTSHCVGPHYTSHCVGPHYTSLCVVFHYMLHYV